TQLIKKEDVPKTLDELANSTLGNRLGRNSLGGRWIAGLFNALGEGPAMETLKKLAAQKPRLYDSNSALTSGLSSGQIVVGYDVNLSDAIIAKNKGAPVDYIIVEPLIVLPVYQVIMNDAPHPFAAALTYDWILSDRGQSAYHALAQLGTRSDIAYPGAEVIKGAKKPPTYLTAALLSDPDRFNKLFEDLFIRRSL
ncbi:MAG: ABC transporter substrate-binding protein, partial [Pseudorhodoplanes sp.]